MVGCFCVIHALLRAVMCGIVVFGWGLIWFGFVVGICWWDLVREDSLIELSRLDAWLIIWCDPCAFEGRVRAEL